MRGRACFPQMSTDRGQVYEDSPLLSKLGKHKMGKSCLYFMQFADLDRAVLERLVADCVSEARLRYGRTARER